MSAMLRRFVPTLLLAMFAIGLFTPTSAAPSTQAKATIRRGATGPLVREAQQRLNIWIARAKPAGIVALPINGTFGPATEATVKAFQRASGLPPVGFIGPQTWAKLPPFGGAPAAPPPAPPANTAARIVISFVNYDGTEYRTEGDEYAVITNNGAGAVNLRSFMLNAGDQGQNFYFPNFTLNAGASVRVHTNLSGAGSFTFGIGRAIWNNQGDCGYLYNAAGTQVDDYCY